MASIRTIPPKVVFRTIISDCEIGSEPAVRQHPRLLMMAGALAGTVALTLALRMWDIGATFASSDQVALPWLVRYQFGIKWLLAHEYGPVPAFIQRSWAELLKHLHIPISEAALRLPMSLLSSLQVPATFLLLRRMRCFKQHAWLGAAICAVLPVLVIDGHYAWGYYTCWLLAGTIAMWSTLAYFDDGRKSQLWLASFALAAHCLSNCFSFGLPIALLWAWWRHLSHARATSLPSFPQARPMQPWQVARSWLIGYLLPCLVALAIIALSWKWTGGGALGRLLHKGGSGCAGLQIMQILGLPRMLASQFGYLFAVLAAAGLCWGTCLRDRRSLLAVWGWMSLLPLTLLADWNRIGYAVSYFNEVSLVSGCLAALLMADVFRRLGGHLGLRVMVAAFSLLAICHMTVASIDAALYDGKLAKFTGVHAGWGSVKPDNGIKAAGWYVRQHVPSDAIVMATHANRGLEVSVAEYYLGRSVLAYCDLQPWMNPPLMKAMQSRVDVFVIEPREIPVVESLPDFEEVATFHCKGIPVRHVYARRTLNLPKIDAPASELAARYNHQYQSYQVPQTIATAPGFDACLAEYLAVVRKLRS